MKGGGVSTDAPAGHRPPPAPPPDRMSARVVGTGASADHGAVRLRIDEAYEFGSTTVNRRERHDRVLIIEEGNMTTSSRPEIRAEPCNDAGHLVVSQTGRVVPAKLLEKSDERQPMTTDERPWYSDYVNDEDEFQIDEYDLTATPNDFNVLTIQSFIESGAVKIPGFQRNYVWDIKRASKLIESLILGLPVPQVFLYEESRNKFPCHRWTAKTHVHLLLHKTALSAQGEARRTPSHLRSSGGHS